MAEEAGRSQGESASRRAPRAGAEFQPKTGKLEAAGRADVLAGL